MKRILICLFCLTFILSGCNLLGPTYYPDEELLVSSNIDGTVLQYSGVVRLHSNRTAYEDSLELSYDTIANKEEFFEPSHEILRGHFEKYCLNDFKLFILMNDVYYVFDIKSYSSPPTDDEENETFELLEYTEEELKSLYPDYKTFNWTECNLPIEKSTSEIQKLEIENALNFSLPKSIEILEYKDTRSDKFAEGYYLKGKLLLSHDAQSQDFVDKIKNSWIYKISDNEIYEEVDKVAFSKDLVPFSDDYYYYYKNDYYDNRDTDFYYGDYFNIFAFDEKNNILYFYISD